MASTYPRAVLSTVVAFLLAFAGTIASTNGASAQGFGAPSVTGQLLRGEAPDYATERFGDPWDYDNHEDLPTDPGPVQGASSVTVGDGRLRMTFEGTGHVHPIWANFPGAIRVGRDGPVNPVDPTRYTHLSLRINTPITTAGQVTWQTCPDIDAGCEGTAGFLMTSTGWQTVTVDLRQGEGQPWAGDIQALRLAIGASQTVSYEIDWMRLHGTAEPARITFSNPALTGTGELLWDADSDPNNNTADNPGWGVVATTDGLSGSGQFDVAAYPAGTYRFLARNGSTTSAYSSPLVIEAAPRIRILDPDVTGGEDFATAVLGNPWDFSDGSDVLGMDNITDVAFVDGMMHGTNDMGGINPRDPWILLSGPGTDLQAHRYHRFTVTMNYDGPFDLSWDPGGGAHGRISWRQDGSHVWQQSAEVVTYTDTDTYTVVMGTDPRSAIMEEDLAQPGWGTGGTTHELRWDVNEDIGPKRWRIDEIRLAADDEAHGSFDITWIDDAHQPGTTIALFADSNDRGFNGQQIASGITTSAGVNTFTWNTRGLPAGTYWVHAEATSPGGVATSRTYATGPVQVLESDFSSVGEPSGLRLAGADRIATAIELASDAFPAGASTAVIARADAFPDALAAAPLATAIDGPVLLNPAGRLDERVADELRRLGVQHVILLGGTAAQSSAVEQQLRGVVGTVEREAGPDRFATAAAIAVRAAREWTARGESVGAPLVALGSRFEDALAAASLAGHARRPLLLVSADVVPEPTAQALADLGASSVTVVGGRGIVQPAMLDGLRAHVDHVEELAGADHVETAVLAARAAVAAGARQDVTLVASGDAFPDALAAGPAAIARGGVLLLTPRDTVGAPTETFLRDTDVSRLRIAGGTAAVSEGVGAQLANAAGVG